MKFSLFLLFSFIHYGYSTEGFDAIQSISTSTMECLKNAGKEFFIARVWKSSGAHDATGIQNVINAHAGGIKYVDGYFFPCSKTSCSSAKTQVQECHQHLTSAGAKIGTLWFDIERYEWPSDTAHNRQFILDLISEAQTLGYTVGIYSSIYEWDPIVGTGWSGSFDKLPLWWPDYNNEKSFSAFKPFGGFTKPSIHQYHGTITGPCGVSMDLSWY